MEFLKGNQRKMPLASARDVQWFVNSVSLPSGESTENSWFRPGVYYNLNPTRIYPMYTPAEIERNSAFFFNAPASNGNETESESIESNVQLYFSIS